MLQMSRTGRLAAREAQSEAVVPDDSVHEHPQQTCDGKEPF
jgi:hypothetical protein